MHDVSVPKPWQNLMVGAAPVETKSALLFRNSQVTLSSLSRRKQGSGDL